MKTKAAVLWEAGPDRKWSIEELELDEPRANEVLVRYVASGLCHSDEHLRDGTLTHRLPIIGGHEGSGVVEAVGPGVTVVEPGDHVVTSWMPRCGQCRFCLTGQSNLCNRGAGFMQGHLMDGTFRAHANGHDLGSMGFVGTFSQRNVVPESSVVKVDQDLPLDVLALTACGVPTGWGSAVYAGDIRPGEVVAVYGVGGVGINAVQGARHAGASVLVAVDPVGHKRELALELGATHAFATAKEAQDFLTEHTWGVGADKAIVTAGVVDTELVQAAFDATRKGGTVVLTGVGDDRKAPVVQLAIDSVVFWQKRIQGSLFGASSPHVEIPKMAALYRNGQLKLDELITTRYKLEDINQASEDLLAGKNLRGVIIHDS